MAAGRFSKQAAPFVQYRFLNPSNFNGDTTPGGNINTSPAANTATQYLQNLPGDRVILDPISANALSNNSVGNLYTGTYRYYGTNNNSSSSPTRGRAVFIAQTGHNFANDAKYQVTSDEPANNGYAYFAGVCINNDTKGNYDWFQESGKTSCAFRQTLSGTGALGQPVYIAAGGNNNNANDVGAFDVLDGGNSAAIFTANSTNAYTTIGAMMVKYVGVSEDVAPSNNNISLVDIDFRRAYRW